VIVGTLSRYSPKLGGQTGTVLVCRYNNKHYANKRWQFNVYWRFLLVEVVKLGRTVVFTSSIRAMRAFS
ncbi:MAG TPA: hypothetical protein PL057_04095, partial [Bacillota bacterium]|nr:hypothetical protein [Bacillota bacterium]HOJ47227.1 hypothetical protein [Bacillota bacterium]HQD77988.1 hypothetical protein [Bacillota bacterium]